MKRLSPYHLVSAILILFCIFFAVHKAIAVEDPNDYEYTGRITLDGRWYIGATRVTATAAELNVLDGYAGTVDDLNEFISGTILTNAYLPASNIVRGVATLAVTNGQQITLKEGILQISNAGQWTTTTNPVIASQSNNYFSLLVAAPANTNTILLKDAAPLTIDGDWSGAAGQWIYVYGNAGAWNEIARSSAGAATGLTATVSIGTQAVVFVNGKAQSVGP